MISLELFLYKLMSCGEIVLLFLAFKNLTGD